MVMTRLPAFHVWKFLMKNMIPTNSGLTIKHKHIPYNWPAFLAVIEYLMDTHLCINQNICY